jgi:hypothetical protein
MSNRKLDVSAPLESKAGAMEDASRCEPDCGRSKRQEWEPCESVARILCCRS